MFDYLDHLGTLPGLSIWTCWRLSYAITYNVLWLPVAPAMVPYSCPWINRCQGSIRTYTVNPSLPLSTNWQMCSRSQDCRINPLQTSVTPQPPHLSVFLWTEPRTSAWASGSVILNDWPLCFVAFNYNSDSCKDQTGPDGTVTNHCCIIMLFRSYLCLQRWAGFIVWVIKPHLKIYECCINWLCLNAFN